MSHDRDCWKCGADTGHEKHACALKNSACVKRSFYGTTFPSTQRRDARTELAKLYGDVTLPMPHYGEARLYCDMDGVAADFDQHYRNLFGRTRERHTNWDDVRSVKDFFLNIPVMADWPLLWAFIKPYRPIFLTGTPSSVNLAGNDKMTWLHENVGNELPVICCKARRKAAFCRPGDVLIDDSEEYRPLWEKAGGIWVTHKSAKDSIEMLKSKGFC